MEANMRVHPTVTKLIALTFLAAALIAAISQATARSTPRNVTERQRGA